MNWSAIGAIALGIAVMTGAFGAHGLRGKLDEYSMGVYEKAVFYHFIHALGLLIVPLFVRTGSLGDAGASRVCWLLAIRDTDLFRQPVRARRHGHQNPWSHHAIWRIGLHRGMANARVGTASRADDLARDRTVIR